MIAQKEEEIHRFRIRIIIKEAKLALKKLSRELDTEILALIRHPNG